MTSRERIMKALKGEKTDRIPWTPLIDGYYLSALKKPVNQVDAIRDIGGDVFARHVPTYKTVMLAKNSASEKMEVSLDDIENVNDLAIEMISRKGDIEIITETRNGHVSLTTKTPIGVLHSKWVYNEVSPYIPFPTEHRIKTVEDLKVFRYVIENMEYEPTYEVFKKEDAYIGDDGIATTTSASSPFHILLESELGVENFYYMMSDYRLEMEETMELMHERNKEIYSIIAASPAEIVIDYENTSTTTMSPEMYEQYPEKHINDYADIMHKSGKIFLTHMCGKLKGLEKQLARTMMDGIVDIAPQPTGNVTLAEAKKMWGKDKIVMGGIDATAFKGLSPEELFQYVKEILKDITPGNGVFLGSGDATPQGTSIENMRAVTDAVRKYGKYPLGS